MSRDLRKSNVAMQYVGWGTQMVVMLGLAVYGGIRLDERIRIKALFVIVFPVIALVISLYQLIRTLNKNKQ